MKYQLYQIHVTDAEIKKINTDGHNSVEKHKMKLDMSFSEDAGTIAKSAFDKGYYTHVSNIETDKGLEGVFEVGNIGPEENIERLHRMYSTSVGDIVVDPAGNKHVVADVGFQEVV
jgi:DNA modification methylase